MTEYSALVGPETAPPRVVSVDGTTVQLHFGRANVRLTFELVFGEEGIDQFLTGTKTRRHALACGGRLTICTPQELLRRQERKESEPQPGIASRPSLREIGRMFGLRTEELDIGARIAWNTILSAYKR